MERLKWLVFGYNLPTEPTRARVSLWRRLKNLGAVNVKQSLWFLPFSDENYASFQMGCEYVEKNGGVSLLLESTALDDRGQDAIVAIFNETRQAEYAELIGECNEFLRKIEKEIADEELSFAEFEEEEARLEKLMSRYSTIVSRDIFSSPARAKADHMIDEAKSAFKTYTDLVFANESQLRGD